MALFKRQACIGLKDEATMSEDKDKDEYTPDEVQELIDWIESLTLSEIAALKIYWEKAGASQPRLQ